MITFRYDPSQRVNLRKETEASLLNYQPAWFERHECDDATDKPYYQ